MSECELLSNFIKYYREKNGYQPEFEKCFNYLQTMGVNHIQIAKCMNKFLSDGSLNGGIYGPTKDQPNFMKSRKYNKEIDLSMGVF
jgi:hypothetical protein